MKNGGRLSTAISRIFFAFSLIFGFYMMSRGHMSHGAGFAGGVIIAIGFLQALAALGPEAAGHVVNARNARLVALASTALLILLSLAGIFYGRGLSANFMGAGTPFTFFGAGAAVLYNIVLCAAVSGCIVYVFLSIINSKPKE